MELPSKKPEKIRLVEINSYLTCYLCKGYLIDATTISECLHSFCRSCVIKFLQENSYCPICEVIINKAKPNLKLDKTLQDIVYKLVPEIFLNEMKRRKQFYQQHPEISAKVSPEERGEDTERTIFNPQDLISLSMEYVCDDSSPGAIKIPGSTNGCDGDKNVSALPEDAQMKRYLQCPGMCRIEVLKKFVRNKYNVDTNLFYIDILYKRVPLPDHYTLIDIAYIYSWKRNEPMKFFFRITDINKATERFDYFNSQQPIPDFIPKVTPVKSHRNNGTNKRRESLAQKKAAAKLTKEPSQGIIKLEPVLTCDKNSEIKSDNKNSDPEKDESAVISKDEKLNGAKEPSEKKENTVSAENTTTSKSETKSKLQETNKVYTNITLNRTNNVEIITKIEKVSNKNGQQIIVKQIKKDGTKSQLPKFVLKQNNSEPKSDTDKSFPTNLPPKEEIVEDEKSRFFKSIQLTAKSAVISKPNNCVKPTGGQKRKNSSPVKKEKPAKKLKIEKIGTAKTKIIIQPKVPSQLLSKKQLVPANSANQSNSINKNGLQSLINGCKINIPSSLSITIKESNDNQSPVQIPPVQNFIEILKIDESGNTKDELPVKMEVNESKSSLKTDFEIASTSKLMTDDEDSEQKVDQDLSEIAKSLTEKIPLSTTVSQIIGPKQNFPIPVKTNAPTTTKSQIQPSPVPEVPSKTLNMPKDNLGKLTPRSAQTFQKIFEESIGKKPDGSSSPNALDLSNETNNTGNTNGSNNGKRNILDIAMQLYKKTKLELEKNKSEEKNEDEPIISTPKVPIARLPNQRNIKPPHKNSTQTVANLHSTSLGMNYSVSIGQNSSNSNTPSKVNGTISPVKTESAANNNKDERQSDSPRLVINLPPETEVNNTKSNENNLNISELKIDLPNGDQISKPDAKKNFSSPNFKSPRHSPKSSPVVKHMYSPIPPAIDHLRLHSPYKNISPPVVNKPYSKSSPKHLHISPGTSKKSSPTNSPKVSTSASTSSSSSKISPRLPNSTQSSPLNSNQLLEMYNIQNLPQLTASLNFNAASFGLNPQLAALQHAMFKHIEIQNRQNWLNMNQGPLLQYEKFLQSLNSNQNTLLGNLKEN